jgi:hypothetical protein
MYRLLPAIILLLSLSTAAQIDSAKLDSFARSVDSSAKAFRLAQDRFNREQDSIYRASQVQQALKNNQRNLDEFLAEQKRRVQKENQQATIRLAMSALLLIIVAVFFWKKRKEEKKEKQKQKE